MADAGVLINLIHVDALQLLGRLVRFEFVVLEHVVQEITRPGGPTIHDGISVIP